MTTRDGEGVTTSPTKGASFHLTIVGIEIIQFIWGGGIHIFQSIWAGGNRNFTLAYEDTFSQKFKKRGAELKGTYQFCVKLKFFKIKFSHSTDARTQQTSVMIYKT